MNRSLVAAICSALSLSFLGPGIGTAEEPVTPGSLEPCPFTAEEIQVTLGIEVENSQAAEMQFPGGREVGCTYATKSGNTSFSVRQTWDPSEGAPSAAEAPDPGKGTDGFTAIPGDPDGAQLRGKNGRPDDEPSVELRYKRDKVQTTVVARGRTIDPAKMEPKLARMRRVP
jgi:hypothetical protein